MTTITAQVTDIDDSARLEVVTVRVDGAGMPEGLVETMAAYALAREADVTVAEVTDGYQIRWEVEEEDHAILTFHQRAV